MNSRTCATISLLCGISVLASCTGRVDPCAEARCTPVGSVDGGQTDAGGEGGEVIVPTDPVETAKLPIVYVWAERSTSANFRGTDVMLDTYDPLPDSAAITGGFKKTNIVDRAADGTETTVFDCIGNSLVHCAALDPKVSPDNTKIVFSVLYAKAPLAVRWTLSGDLPIPLLGEPAAAVIHLYDTTTRTITSWPRVEGVLDVHPDWISNDTLVFVSTRAKVYPLRMPYKSTPYPSSHSLQRWTAKIDGSDAVNIGPHDDMALHPLVLSDGNIVTSTWRVDEHLSENLTPANQYWMTMTNQFGGDEVSVLGAHSKMFSEDGLHWDEQVSLHFFGERSNGDLMTADYYRGNNLGLGMPIAFPRLPYGVEGVGNTFHPAIYRLLPWAQEDDTVAFTNPAGHFLGKGGYPAGLPGGEVMVTLGKGACFSALPVASANPTFFNGPGCDTGIYVQKTFPSQSPDDLVQVVDLPTRHEFAARVRLPYRAIYGKSAPTVQRRDDRGECSLRVVNARVGKLVSGGEACSKEGACIEAGASVADVAKLALYEAKPNLTAETTVQTTPLEGQEMRLLGYAHLEADGSVNVRIPCDTPYKLRGVAADGREFIRDQIKHSNRPGEARTCQGCHAGHNGADHVADVRSDFDATLAGRKPAVDLTSN